MESKIIYLQQDSTIVASFYNPKLWLLSLLRPQAGQLISIAALPYKRNITEDRSIKSPAHGEIWTHDLRVTCTLPLALQWGILNLPDRRNALLNYLKHIRGQKENRVELSASIADKSGTRTPWHSQSAEVSHPLKPQLLHFWKRTASNWQLFEIFFSFFSENIALKWKDTFNETFWPQ